MPIPSHLSRPAFLCFALVSCVSDPGQIGFVTMGEGEPTSDSGTTDAETGEDSSGGETSEDSTTDDRETTGEDPDPDPDPGPGICGDNEVDADEDCDDGNQTDGDGCELDCTFTTIERLIVGAGHNCVVLDSGKFKCWGQGSLGQLGYGNRATIGDNEHVKVVGTVDTGGPVSDIALGGGHTCILYENGDVKCYGRNLEGQTGYGHTELVGGEETPAQLEPIELGGPAARIYAGAFFSCALMVDGSFRCWGENSLGQLGLGHTESIGDDELPTAAPPVSLPVEPVDIVIGYGHSCAITADHQIACWGYNPHGQLGYGHTENIGDDELPNSVGLVDVGGPIEQLSLGTDISCAKLMSGELRCWGYEALGSLGTANDSYGDDEPASFAPPLQFSDEVVDFGAGSTRGCALLSTGIVECWGDNREGQAGLGHTIQVTVPAATPGAGIGGTAVALGSSTFNHACALLDSNEVICWGEGSNGKLGQGLSEANIGDNELPSAWGPIIMF